jgi:hypothetical protein
MQHTDTGRTIKMRAHTHTHTHDSFTNLKVGPILLSFFATKSAITLSFNSVPVPTTPNEITFLASST